MGRNIQINITRLSLKMLLYSVFFGVFLSLGWIDPQGSIIHNIAGGFIIWVLPQVVIYFFIRGKAFGLNKRWLVRGVIYAMLLTVFLNQRWIIPEGVFINNLMFGLILYLASYFIAFMFD